ncbi:hypothetical protein ElyMa_001572900 [Elysia marginata]|uniref:DNA helicase Pif1-like 2B domain-containing protein n=1 Tax=Elysia marginata TaxID=1093978 RepID=A0AAV4JCW3_9GAST|nr:hypothetical protein ElyMa_001572900 [Elysia marginata]
MRVALQADERAEMFANKLVRLGNGETDTVQSPDYVSLLNFGTPAENIDILLDRIYPQIHSNYENHTWLIQRAILAPHNDSVSQINKLLAEKLPTQTHTYSAINLVVDEEQAVQFPVEFLISIEVSGLPPHVFDLKCGMPVMLLRSIKPPELNVLNGTRCIIYNCNRRFVEVVIAAGIYSGQHHSIPSPQTPCSPSSLKGNSFPYLLCHDAMTINKAQGQTLKVIGLDLRQPMFAHGHVMRREKLEHLITTGKLDGKRGRGKQREKMIDGLKRWLGSGSWTETMTAMGHRELWRNMIADASKHGTG